jgi:hypothetical protein
MRLTTIDMKQLTLISMALLAFGLAACKKEKKKIGDPASKLEGINASWVLTRVDQIDVTKTLVFVESDTLLEVTEAFAGNNPMTLDIKSTDFSYAITAGTTYNLFPKTSGNWKFDDVQYPSRVIFDEATAEELSMKLLRPVRPQDPNLVLKLDKRCNGKRTTSYHLWFTRKS